MGWYIALAILGLVLIVLLIRSFRLVRQSTVVIVERLGVYNRTLSAGLRFVIPFFERANAPISLKERIADFKPQPVITKDNVVMHIDTVIYFQVFDPKLYTYGVEHPMNAIDNLTATTLRNLVGDLELDQTLTSRDTVNNKMQLIIDEATDPWGIKVNRVELKNIILPKEIQESMEKQMRAERGKREAILNAEGVKQAAILVAEGEKQASVLRAEAKKIATLTEAEGQAEAIKRIINANPSAAYVTLQGFEALKVLAQGSATKIVVPSQIADITGLLASMTEVVKTPIDETSSAKKK